MSSEDEERLVFLENEVLSLRTRCDFLEVELTARKDQVSQLDKLRQSFDSTKRQLMNREAEIAELKSKLDLNELEMKADPRPGARDGRSETESWECVGPRGGGTPAPGMRPRTRGRRGRHALRMTLSGF